MKKENHNFIIEQNLNEHIAAIEKFKDITLQKKIIDCAKEMAKTLKKKGSIFFCGNGGSAADSQHLAAELVGRFKKNRRALKSIALTTDSSVLTCIANDYSYDEIFSRQIEALGDENDITIVISTSGKSPNIVNAVKAAKKLKMKTIGLLGKDGGLVKNEVDYPIIVDSNTTATIQEMHIFLGHIFCEIIECELKLN